MNLVVSENKNLPGENSSVERRKRGGAKSVFPVQRSLYTSQNQPFE
jgi:hypothetical protein